MKIDQLIPTRSAAMTLLVLDGLLLPVLLFVDWNSWFAIAYAPLLFTAVLGFVFVDACRVPLLIASLSVSSLPLVIGIVLVLPFHDLSWTMYALLGYEVLLAAVVIMFAVLAIRGWMIFFRNRLYESLTDA